MVSVLGAGYVGVTAASCFADAGLEVSLLDIDEDRVRSLERGCMPIHEPGLREIYERNLQEGRLRPTACAEEALAKARWAFVTVGTPPLPDGASDLRQVEAAARTVACHAPTGSVLAIKSTVPVGTADRMRKLLEDTGRGDIAVVSNPEFLREGQAVVDFTHPDRLVVGCREREAGEAIVTLHQPYLTSDTPVFLMDNRSAEMSKYAANAFLAARISLINEIANLCEPLGADVDEVRKAIGTDRRIGSHFLYPGVGYGGSCLPKDVRSLIALGDSIGYEAQLLKGVHAVNERQKRRLAQRISEYFKGDMAGRTIALWGLSFKRDTDDIRESPSLCLIEDLLAAGCRIQVFDPAATHRVKERWDVSVIGCPTLYDAVANADALAVITDWQEFRMPDWGRVRRLMRTPVVFDGRNLYRPEQLVQAGFTYVGIGRPVVLSHMPGG